jgi:DNA-binding Lrp family transcriptional regulator
MGDGWRLKVLDRSQVAVMNRGTSHGPVGPGSDGFGGVAGDRPIVVRPYDAIDRQVILLLGEDGRMSVPTIAARTGLSDSTIRRRLAELVKHGRVVLRADMALPASGWPVITWIWAYASPDDTETLSTILRQSQNIRVCWRISGGQPNLLLALNTHSIHEVPAIEAQLAEVAPRLAILDRSMVLRSIKRMGRELDAAGRSTAAVPMDIWSEPVDPAPPNA